MIKKKFLKNFKSFNFLKKKIEKNHKKGQKTQERSFLIMEKPLYRIIININNK
jgi:hypothetical protein